MDCARSLASVLFQDTHCQRTGHLAPSSSGIPCDRSAEAHMSGRVCSRHTIRTSGYTMEGEIVTLRGHSELRFSNRLDLITGSFDPDGSVQLWIQEWKPRFQIVPLRVRHGDSF